MERLYTPIPEEELARLSDDAGTVDEAVTSLEIVRGEMLRQLTDKAGFRNELIMLDDLIESLTDKLDDMQARLDDVPPEEIRAVYAC